MRASMGYFQNLTDAAFGRTTTPKPTLTHDGLANIMSGAGTSIDKSSYDQYVVQCDNQQVMQSYRASWIMRKIVDMPARDMTRKGRAWQGEPEEVEARQEREKELKLWAKLKKALKYGDLGGGAIFLGTNDANLDQPINEGAELTYLHVFTRDELSFERLIRDPRDPLYGEPELWTLNAGNTGSVFIHPSRFIPFKGRDVPDRVVGSQSEQSYWGDPVYTSVRNAVQNADKAADGFASLIDEAKTDTYKFKQLTQLLGDAEGEKTLKRRVEATQMGASIHRSRILDTEDEWETRQVNWSNMDKVSMHYLATVAGAADIPATRFLGKSPDGMNSSGEGDEQNYLDRLSSDQVEKLKPALDHIDQFMFDQPLEWSFPPLSEMTEKEKAEIGERKSKAIVGYIQAGALSADAVADVAPAMLEADGILPGIKDAQDALPDFEPDPRLEGGATDMVDAAPRTLYVSRPVLNRSEIQDWAAEQGLGELQEDLHVTIAYSRTPVDWIAIEGEWNQEKDGTVTIEPGGPRLVEPLGDRTAVLMFSSSRLGWRHEQIKHNGASWDYPDYQPHISLTGESVDLEGVEAYQGAIELGPEKFEEVRD